MELREVNLECCKLSISVFMCDDRCVCSVVKQCVKMKQGKMVNVTAQIRPVV